jgi:hypothetical protein
MNAQSEKMTKHELLDQIRSERGWLEELLSHLTDVQMLLPGVDGKWSAKDALAHVSAWERRMISWVGSHLRGEEPAIPLPWDVERMNTETYIQFKDQSLAEVLKEFHISYMDSLALTESLSEEQLQTVYADTWPMGPLWTGIAANMNWHYKEHSTDIEKWLETRKLEN